MRKNIRSVAIIAHVDHGKTTLVDALFTQGGIYRAGQVVEDRVMDSIDQERERGITIMAKVTSVQFANVHLQLVDTPGHADFGGEVERSLRMVDGVLLLVDAAEGPLPQTRFVLRKALELNLPAVVAVNKIDRADARPTEVLNALYSLFIDLGASEAQLDFPVVYTNARSGTATRDLATPGTDLRPLVDAIVAAVPPPEDRSSAALCLQVNALGYDDYVGRLVIGRVLEGSVAPNQLVRIGRAKPGTRAPSYQARISGVYTFHGPERVRLDRAEAGEIVALSGFDDIAIGDTVTAVDDTRTLEPIAIDEPAVAMVFQINDGPLSGRSGGKFVTSRQLGQRLQKEAYANAAIRLEPGEKPDQFRVLGRGELQLAVVVETLRREGYELCLRNPQVVTRERDGITQEPVEHLVVDVPIEFSGAIADLLGPRRAQMLDQRQEGSRTRLTFAVPTRGLFGLRNQMLTTTRGTALAHSVVDGWMPWSGPIPSRTNGALVSDRAGVATTYALFNLQPRGTLFVTPGTQVYEGMIIGEHTRGNDLNVNVCREKKLTNVRAAGKDDATILAPPRQMPLERCIEWLRDDEMVEVTPNAIRLRKRVLAANRRD